MLAGIRGLVETDDARGRACTATAGVRHVTGRSRVEHAWVARCDGDVCLNDTGQPFRHWFPGRAAIGRFEDAVSCAAKSLPFEEALLLLPERRIDHVRVRRIDADVVAAGVLVFVEDLLEGAAAVDGSENAPFGVRPVRVAERRDEEAIGIARVDVNHRDHLRVTQPEIRPGPPRVGRLVDTVANGEIGPDDSGAGADVDDVPIGGRDGNGANRSGRLIVEDRLPRRTVVGGAPHAAVVEPDIEHVRLARHARERARAARAGRADVPPLHRGGAITRLARDDGSEPRQHDGRRGPDEQSIAHGITTKKKGRLTTVPATAPACTARRRPRVAARTFAIRLRERAASPPPR